jgi:WhiB family transcriptional regulator, redox-sensing transcriptional regulator
MSRQTNGRVHAACRNADPGLFFPEVAAGPALEAAEQAKRVCRMCPVRARCLEWALGNGAAFGIWGGRTPDERRAVRVTSA